MIIFVDCVFFVVYSLMFLTAKVYKDLHKHSKKCARILDVDWYFYAIIDNLNDIQKTQ